MKKILLLISACLVAGIIVFQFNSAEVSEGRHTAVFTGMDLTCKGCSEEADNALDKVIGIKDYRINPKNNSIIVTYETDRMKAEWISRSLEAAGFSVADINIRK